MHLSQQVQVPPQVHFSEHLHLSQQVHLPPQLHFEVSPLLQLQVPLPWHLQEELLAHLLHLPLQSLLQVHLPWHLQAPGVTVVLPAAQAPFIHFPAHEPEKTGGAEKMRRAETIRISKIKYPFFISFSISSHSGSHGYSLVKGKIPFHQGRSIRP
jgi:hypothetical protein